jgi:hypothetical protein
MKLIKFIFFLLLVLAARSSFAQIKAVTENGDQVLLSPNGTWRYLEATKNEDSIGTNPTRFAKSANANFLLKSKNISLGFLNDTKKLNFEKSTDNTTEYTFSLRDNSSVGAFVVVESVGMDLQALRKIALDNIQKEATSFNLIHEEYRSVNNLKILHVEINATVQGMQLVYLCYYYTDDFSTVQFISYISKNFVVQYKKAAEDFLNGLIVFNGKDNDFAGDSNTAIKSSLVPGSNCKVLFKGTWSYAANGKKYIDKIDGTTMIETNYSDAASTEYKIKWVNNCKYQLIMVHSNDKAMALLNPGSVITIEILEMDDKIMRYQLEYGTSRVNGIMEKEG